MNSRRKSRLLVSLLAGAAIAAGGVLQTAQSAEKFPSGPIQLIVPWKPGGGTDRSARIFAPFLAKELGVPVKIINVAGGGGWVAWSQMAKWDAKKDDHLLGYVNFPHMLSLHNPNMKRKETLKSFNFVSGHSMDPCIWAVREGDERFQTLKEFIAYAQKNPGKILMSVGGRGSDDHQGVAYAEKFIKGFKVRTVYGNSDAKKIREALGKHTDAIGGNVGYFIPHMLEGKLRAIAVLDKQRSPFLPTVPTFKEITGIENICFAGRALVVAPGLAQDKYDVYAGAIKTALANPNYAIKELKNGNGMWPVTGQDLWTKLEDTSATVKKVKYWEIKE